VPSIYKINNNGNADAQEYNPEDIDLFQGRSDYIKSVWPSRLMASQKLTNCGVTVIVSLLRRTYKTLHATSLQGKSRALHLALFA
jgi:hypothetical protein